MAKLSDEEKAARARERLLESAKQYQIGTYAKRFVATVFQSMVRAEYGCSTLPYYPAVVDGKIRQVPRRVGQVVCVTCGKVGQWSSGLGGMHTGHFVGSRCNSILFEETNVAPQCSRCNVYMSGEASKFRLWMLAIRGEAVVERLERLKPQTRSFTRDELVDLLICFRARLKAAEQAMGDAT